MKRYNVIFNEEEKEGVYAISVVEEPAMESFFIALSKNKKPSLNIELKESEEGKKENVLLGVALIPDKPVYRNQGGEEFEIIFSKETIKKAAHNFLKNGYQHNSSIEHEKAINGVSIVESWIVKDSKNDAANAYGLKKEDIVNGAWIVKMKCDNEEIYNKAINGEIKGFSIDGLFNLEEVNLKTNVKMSDELKENNSILKKLEALLLGKKENQEVKIELKTAKLKGGEVTIGYEGEELKEGANVWIVNGDDQVPAPVGEHELEDGSIIVVEEEGLIARILKANEEEVEMSQDKNGFSLDDIASLLVKFKEETNLALKQQKEELTKDFELKLSTQKENFDKQLNETPAAVELKSAPIQTPKNAKERIYNTIIKHN